MTLLLPVTVEAGAPRRARRPGRLRFVLFVLACFVLIPMLAASARVRPYDPTFRRGKPGDVLLGGPPLLRRGHLDDFVDLFESAFDLSLGSVREQQVRDALETRYESWGANERKGWHVLVQPMAGLRTKARAGESQAVHQGLRTFRERLDAWLGGYRTHPVVPHIERALAQRHLEAWPGRPVIKRNAADSWLEVALFVTNLARNEDWAASAGQKKELDERMIKAVASFSAASAEEAADAARRKAVRQRLSRAHMLWRRVQAAWDTAKPADRFRMRWEAVEMLARILPEDRRPSIERGNTLPDYAAAAASLRQLVGPYDAFGNVAANPELVFLALEKGLGLKEEGPDLLFLGR